MTKAIKIRCQWYVFVVLAYLFLITPPLQGQSPCRDTVVLVYDSICEGLEYDFNGRVLTYSGVYYDTLQRIGTDCDSFIVLRLAVLEIPEVGLYPRTFCRDSVGYGLYGTDINDMYYVWSSNPHDPALDTQQHRSYVHVNPDEPTTYMLYVDYRETPQCPGTGSRLLNPIVPVIAGMRVTPAELSLDQMEFTVEDVSTNTRENHWGGWSGRHWSINGVRQIDNHEFATFAAEPWWSDTVELMMLAYTPTCFDSVTKLIPFKKVLIAFPNVFTPDCEGNSHFAPVVKGVIEFEMWIYDRRGVLVYHTNDVQKPWDGMSQGVRCPQGGYTYYCRYRDILTPHGYQSRNGTVTLIR